MSSLDYVTFPDVKSNIHPHNFFFQVTRWRNHGMFPYEYLKRLTFFRRNTERKYEQPFTCMHLFH